MAIPVYAKAYAYTTGSTSTMTVDSEDFTAFNTLYTGREGNDAHKFARGYIDIDTYYNQPANKMGVQPVIYNNSDIAVVTGNWYYNTSNVSGMSHSVTLSGFSGSPYLKAKGNIKIKYSNFYINYSSNATILLNDYS
jgi:hypothetical protein